MSGVIRSLFEGKHKKKIRFALIGALNTGIDFGIFFFLTAIGVNTVVANTISTSAGVVCSYTLNRKYTFTSRNQQKRPEIIKFLTITLVGLWVLQPIVINVIIYAGQHVSQSINEQLLRAVGKLVATGVSLIWNYAWYNAYVFKAHDQPGR